MTPNQDMHYAEFAEDEVSLDPISSCVVEVLTREKSTALLAAIKEYDANKWKVIGQKVGKPAKVSVSISSSGRLRGVQGNVWVLTRIF
jgi:hypothetical protein